MDDDTDSDPDAPLDADLAPADDALPEMMCPRCRGPVTEDTQKCPHCGDWITAVEPATGRHRVRRWVFVVAVALMLLAMWRFLVG